MKYLALGLLIACNGDKGSDKTGDTGGGTTPGEEFDVLGDDTTLPAASLLSVWGTSSNDVFIVGGDDGNGPVALHWDGTSWSRIDTSASPGDLWWVRASAGSDLVWMSGEGGRVLQYSRESGSITEVAAASSVYTMFGVWPFADDDVYAVGSDISNTAEGTVVHWDGTAWTEVYAVHPNGVTRREPFKVWGSAPDDVWVVGTQALVTHWDGAAWTDVPDLGYGSNTYFTVDGSGPDNVVFVGGEGNAAAFSYDGSSWSDVTPPPQDVVPVMFGVSVNGAHGTAMCGSFGSIWWRTDTGWEADPRPRATSRDLHSCWIDDQGEIWAVGDAANNGHGVVLYGGDSVPDISL